MVQLKSNYLYYGGHHMKFDFHTHHDRCGHAQGTIREYIEAALQNNLQIIGISDHSPMLAEQEDRPSPGGCMAKSEFTAYVEEVLELKQEFAGQIDVLLGVEADFIPEHLELYGNFLRQYPFDYIIGSVHEFAGIGLYDTGHWEQLTSAGKFELKNSYYNYVTQSAKSGLYDILGHVDALNRYFPGYPELRTELADTTLQTIANHDVVIEINSSDDNWVPDSWILERALHYGVKTTFGSDAHEPERVGDAFEEVKKHLLDIGYREWAIFKNRKRTMIPL